MSLRANRSHVTSANHGWFLTSCGPPNRLPNLLVKSAVISRSSKFWASGFIYAGYLTLPLRMFSYMRMGEPLSQKGVYPQSISYIKIPRDHLIMCQPAIHYYSSINLENRNHSPVHRLVVAFVRDYLRSQIIRCTTQRPRLVWHSLCEAKVGDFEMSMPVQQQILRFQIAVYNVFGMQVFQRQRGFGSVEFGDRIGETL